MKYRIELPSSEDFFIIDCDSEEEVFKESRKVTDNFLNIFEINENNEIIRLIW